MVPPFSLTERSGRTVEAGDLRGRVWIASFIFTRCPDVCPAITARMASFQEPLARAGVQLVSFSVDPSHDTPEVLSAYAARVGAGSNWWFLTGAREVITTLLRDGFHVAFASDDSGVSGITHSDRLMLVDRTQHIRGSYHASDPDEMAALVRDATRLAAD